MVMHSGVRRRNRSVQLHFGDLAHLAELFDPFNHLAVVDSDSTPLRLRLFVRHDGVRVPEACGLLDGREWILDGPSLEVALVFCVSRLYGKLTFSLNIHIMNPLEPRCSQHCVRGRISRGKQR
jgi:hypothetical protein